MPVETPQYPVNLVVAGRRCLVVGGGTVAARKARSLVECGARVHVVAEDVGQEILRLAEDLGTSLTWEERAYVPGEIQGYRLAVAATDDPGVNRRVYEDGDALGVWVNSADDVRSSSFTLPSVLRRGPVMITVSTGGQSPALASWLRSLLAEQFGPEYQALAELLSTERDAIKAAGGSTEERDWQKALQSDMLALLRAGRIDLARERLRECLSSS